MNGWRDGEDVYVSIGGTGSISCRGITEDEGLESERRKQPIGFRLPEGSHVASGTVTYRLVLADGLENEGLGWGEALWTARDIAGL